MLLFTNTCRCISVVVILAHVQMFWNGAKKQQVLHLGGTSSTKMIIINILNGSVTTGSPTDNDSFGWYNRHNNLQNSTFIEIIFSFSLFPAQHLNCISLYYLYILNEKINIFECGNWLLLRKIHQKIHNIYTNFKFTNILSITVIRDSFFNCTNPLSFDLNTISIRPLRKRLMPY